MMARLHCPVCNETEKRKTVWREYQNFISELAVEQEEKLA
jgi:hypothetical protein